jgi:hypothetical protein
MNQTSNKFYNPEFEARNAAIQAEIEKVFAAQTITRTNAIDLKIER